MKAIFLVLPGVHAPSAAAPPARKAIPTVNASDETAAATILGQLPGALGELGATSVSQIVGTLDTKKGPPEHCPAGAAASTTCKQ